MYVYMIASPTNSTLYVGVTNNLERRIFEHKEKIDLESFTARYNCYKLVYYEVGNNPEWAIEREKQTKKYRREKENALIEKENPYWKDLAIDWYN